MLVFLFAFFFLLPLIFNLLAASISRFLIAAFSTSFSCFAQKISTISHSLNLLFPSFEVKIFQLTPLCVLVLFTTDF